MTRIRRITVISIAFCFFVLGVWVARAQVDPHYVRFPVRGWPCEEDQVLRGRGDFDGTSYDRYACWNPRDW